MEDDHQSSEWPMAD